MLQLMNETEEVTTCVMEALGVKGQSIFIKFN